MLTAADFPPGVQYDRIATIRPSGDGAGGPPTMLSTPEGCSDGLTKTIADSAERGAGSAAEYVVAYDGARDRDDRVDVAAGPRRTGGHRRQVRAFQGVLRPVGSRHSDHHDQAGHPARRRAGVPADDATEQRRQQCLLLVRECRQHGGVRHRLPTPNPSISVKASLPQTFLDIAAKQAERAESD